MSSAGAKGQRPAAQPCTSPWSSIRERKTFVQMKVLLLLLLCHNFRISLFANGIHYVLFVVMAVLILF